MKILISKDNNEIKHLKRLISDTDYRYEKCEYVIEGIRSLDNNNSIKTLYIREDAKNIPKISAKMVYLAEKLFNAISQTKNSQGIMAISEFSIFRSNDLRKNERYLLLDKIQDPGNMGTIIRTACAFNIAGIILTEGSVDPFSPKVARSAMSALNNIKIFRIKSFQEINDFRIIAADISGTNIKNYIWPNNFILAVGNEANGLSNELIEKASDKVSIQMSGKIESLNAAVACGIILFNATVLK